MSEKGKKFSSLLRSPSGSTGAKEEMLKPVNPVEELVPVTGKKKATFELDVELHRWLRMHSVTTNKKMIDIVEELLRKYRQEVEGK